MLKRLRNFFKVKIIDYFGNPIGVQYPLSVDGDSIYEKDLDIDNCTASGFTFDVGSGTEAEVISDMVKSVFAGKSNASSDNPKTIYLQFKRPVLTSSFGINSAPGKYFSNTKIVLGQGEHSWTAYDDSGDATQHQIFLFDIQPVKFSSMLITFHTANEIGIGLIGIFKNIEVAARIQALKPDGTVTDIDATTNGNLKVSVEESEPGFTREFFTEVKLGNISGYRLIHKFGRNDAIGTSPTAVAVGGVYATPTANTALEILSSSASDAVGGGGATKVCIEGLVITGGLFVAQSETIILTGTTPVALVNNYVRIFRAYICETESYASLSAISGVGTITIRVSGAGATWLQIAQYASGNSAGQSQTAFYTTPSATSGIIYSPQFTVDSLKVTNIAMFKRENADDVTTPYTGARRMIHQWDGVDKSIEAGFMVPYATFEGATDIGMLASVSATTGTVSAEFWVLEIDD